MLTTALIGLLGTAGVLGVGKIGKGIYRGLTKDRELEAVRYTWLEVLVASKCTIGNIEDGTGKTFDLMDLKRTNYGYSGTSLLPYGLCIDNLLERRRHLQGAFNGMVRVEKKKYKDPKIYIKIINEIPTFNYEAVKTDLNHIWIGYGHDGTPKIKKLDECSQWITLGTSGTGKSTFIATVLTNLMYNGTDKKGRPLLDIYYAQRSKSDSYAYSRCKHTAGIIAGLKDVVELIAKLRVIAEKRDEKIRKKGLENVEEWNKIYGKTDFIKRKFLVIDEIASYSVETTDLSEVKELKLSFWESLTALSKVARSGGIHAILGTQRGTAKSLGGDGELRAGLMKICLTLNSKKESGYVLDIPDGALLEKREAIFAGFGEPEDFIVPTLKNGFSDLKKYVPELIAKEDFLNLDGLNDDELKDKNLKQCNNKNEVNLTLNQLQNKIKLDAKDTQPTFFKALELEKRDKEIALSLNKATSNDASNLSDLEFYNKNIYPHIKRGKHDMEMYKFMEGTDNQKFKAMTVEQIHQMFWFNPKNPKSSYTMCTNRIRVLEEKGVLLSYDLDNGVAKNGNRQKVIYFNRLGREYTWHELQPTWLYIQLMKLGAKDIKLTLTPHLESYAKNFIPDAVLEFNLNNVYKKVYFEGEYTHETKQHKIKLYERLAEKEQFDLIMAKDGVECKEIKVKSNKFRIIKCDFDDYSNINSYFKSK